MRLASASLVLPALAVLAACGSGDPAAQPSEGSATTQAEAPAAATGDGTPALAATPEPAPSTATFAGAPPAAKVAAAPPAAFMQCRSCHSVEPGKNLIGPSLAGIYGQKAAALPGFAYSKALRESGLSWDEATLDAWLAGPTKLVPGARMVIPVPDAARRQDIIAYLKTLK